MSMHQCPKCELRFEWKTELDDHCWHDHPEFRHEYPASPPAALAQSSERPHVEPVPRAPIHLRIGDVFNWLSPGRR